MAKYILANGFRLDTDYIHPEEFKNYRVHKLSLNDLCILSMVRKHSHQREENESIEDYLIRCGWTEPVSNALDISAIKFAYSFAIDQNKNKGVPNG